MHGRVAHVLRKYDPSEWGGTETHVVEVCRRLPPLGWATEVHAPRGPTTRGEALPEDVPLVRYRSFLPFVGSRARRMALVSNAGNIASIDEVWRLARSKRITLAHLHTMGRIGGAVRTAMLRTGRPYVVSVHGPLFADAEWLAEDTARRLSGVVDLGKPIGLVLGSRRVLDDAARVITFNEPERRAVAERVGDRAVTIPHGVDEQRIAAGDIGRARTRWPELGDAPVVSIVGRLCEQKNQILALHAFARGAPSDHQLVLAGATTDRGYSDRLRETARELGLGHRVHPLGNLDSNTEVPDLYARSTLLMVPSVQEAFGLVVLEGWAASRPVLFARRSGLLDIARALDRRDPDVAATVEGDDVDAWATALARLLENPELRAKNVEAGRSLLRARYSWDRVAQDLADLYGAVVDERRMAS